MYKCRFNGFYCHHYHYYNYQQQCCLSCVTAKILQRVEPLLCNDRQMGGYILAISEQRLGKHVPDKQTTEQRPLVGSRFLIINHLDHNNERAVFSTWSVPRGYT
jgi:hypothetical protein